MKGYSNLALLSSADRKCLGNNVLWSLHVGTSSQLCLLRARKLLIEIEIQLENIDSRFAENAELSCLRVFLDEIMNPVGRSAALPRNTRDLELRSGGSDVWIDARGRCSDQIDGQRGQRHSASARLQTAAFTRSMSF